jgi:hypothetical protein
MAAIRLPDSRAFDAGSGACKRGAQRLHPIFYFPLHYFLYILMTDGFSSVESTLKLLQNNPEYVKHIQMVFASQRRYAIMAMCHAF